MKHALVTKIDDHPIHGQVVTAWIKQYPINKILIVDSELSRDKLIGRIYKAVAPVGIEVVIMDQEMAEEFLKEDPGSRENLMILVKIPRVLEKLIGSRTSIDKIILGGMGTKPGRKTFSKNVSANGEKTKCFKRVIGDGMKIYYQLVPNDKEVNIRRMLS